MQAIDPIANKKIANRVSVITMIFNLLLSAFKFFAGTVAHSSAMISDAVNSASDVFSTIVVLIGVNMASKKADKNHPYGHERMESIAAIVLSFFLFITAAGIMISGVQSIFSTIVGNPPDVPGVLALVAAIVSIVVKEAMYWYTRKPAKKINSAALMAVAWDHRSDALSSVGSLIGIGGAMLGFPVLDSVAALLIGLMIIKVGFDISRDAMGQLVDKAVDEETQHMLINVVLNDDEVKKIDSLKTRIYGNRLYVDIEIAVEPQLTLMHAHTIAQRVHDALEGAMPEIKHCMIHVNPYTEG